MGIKDVAIVAAATAKKRRKASSQNWLPSLSVSLVLVAKY